MIKIIAKAIVKKENLDAFLEYARPLVAASQAEEGNVSYNLHQAQSNPEEIVFIEAWKDQKAIDIHNATAHFNEAVPKLGELCDGEMIVEKYDVLI